MAKKTEDFLKDFRESFENFMKEIEGKNLSVLNIIPELLLDGRGAIYGRSLTFHVEYEMGYEMEV